MHGPRYARTGPRPRARNCSTARSTTPSSRPRCPACTTPTASSHARATGAQSAVSTATGRPGVAVTAASASGGSAPVGPDATCTAAPCTWRIHTQPVGSPSPASSPTRARFDSTAAGSSPTWSPTLHVSYGGAETPPVRALQNTTAGPRGTRVSTPRFYRTRSAQEFRDVEVVVAEVERVLAGERVLVVEAQTTRRRHAAR